MIVSTFLISPTSNKARRPSRHHSPSSGETDWADRRRHVDGLHQMHQRYVIGDVGAILLVDEPFVLDDTVHLVALLCWWNIHGRVHVVLSQTHTPVRDLIEWARNKMIGWICLLSSVCKCEIIIILLHVSMLLSSMQKLIYWPLEVVAAPLVKSGF